MGEILKHIDTNIAGTAVVSAKINLSSFVAGFIQRIINTSEYSSLSYEIQGQISHLSFLVHLVCRNNNFDVIYEEHESIQNDINQGFVRWTDQSYFSQWERLMLTKYVGYQPKEELDDNWDNDNDKGLNEMFEQDMKESVEPVKISFRKKKYKQVQKKDKKVHDNKEKYGESGDFPCVNCPGFHATRARDYYKHLFEEHNANLCTKCGQTFTKFVAYWYHVKEKNTNCPRCPESFTHQCYYETHMMQVHNHKINSQKAFKNPHKICPYCGDVVTELKEHMIKKGHLVPSELHKCPHCDYTHHKQSNIRHHIDRKHNTESVISCPYCGKRVKAYCLKRHIRLVKCNLSEEEREIKSEYPCPECGKLFANEDNVKKHIVYYHRENQKQHCQLCNFTTKYAYNMRMHMKRVHEHKPFWEQCRYCEQKVSNMKSHISTYHPEISLLKQ